MASGMATSCFVSRMTVEKVTPNVAVVHTPPPTGNITTPPGENKNTGRTK